MVKDINELLKENEQLIRDNALLKEMLDGASEIIEVIKKESTDAIFIAKDDASKVLVSKTVDLTYRMFIESMAEGVVTLHADGIILYSNTSFAEIVHLPLENVVGTNLRNYIPAGYIQSFNRFFDGSPGKESKMELAVSDDLGNRTHFIVSLSTLYLQDFVALNLVWTDVTVQKETEEELISANENLKMAIKDRILSENNVLILNNKLKEGIEVLKEANIELATFVHIASHDLQEPLRKIMTYSNRLQSDYSGVIDPLGREYINKLQGSSTRMRDLIQDILKYSELSHNDSLFEPVNLQSIVREIVTDLEIILRDTKAKIIIKNALPVIKANPSQMRQLFQNIISNALKFIRDGVIPEIDISYEMMTGKEIDQVDERLFDEKFFVFYIKDNGMGFNQEYITKIFTIFQRLNNNVLYKGTGIGLAICKRIVEKHNGFITADSKIDEGALFTITLPVSQVDGKQKG